MDAHDLFNPKKADDKRSGGFFGGVKKPALFSGPNLSQVSGEVNNISRRLRTLEERYLNLRKKTQLTEQNMIASNKKLLLKVRESFDDISEIRTDLKKLNEQLITMNSELQDCANRNELMTIDKYISFWEPMNFLTENQAKKIIENFK